jgi:Flp pilus assembly protein TadG
MDLSEFLNIAVALAVILPPMIGLLAFFIWIATVVQEEE